MATEGRQWSLFLWQSLVCVSICPSLLSDLVPWGKWWHYVWHFKLFYVILNSWWVDLGTLSREFLINLNYLANTKTHLIHFGLGWFIKRLQTWQWLLQNNHKIFVKGDLWSAIWSEKWCSEEPLYSTLNIYFWGAFLILCNSFCAF